MADEPNKLQERPPTFRAALMNTNPKIALAFFLVFVAAVMVLIWMVFPPKAGPGGVDAGTIALIASMITLFIKMAADSVGYQYNSSSGSDKKDDTQAAVAGKLADKVAPQGVAPAATPVAWWSRLRNGEPAGITAAAASDPRIMAFVTAANVGAATVSDLDYLVTKGLLTQDRATAIAAT